MDFSTEKMIILIACLVAFNVLMGMIAILINKRHVSFWLGFLFGIFGLIICAIMYNADKEEVRKNSAQTNASIWSTAWAMMAIPTIFVIGAFFNMEYEQIKHEEQQHVAMERKEQRRANRNEYLAEKREREYQANLVRREEARVEAERLMAARRKAEERAQEEYRKRQELIKQRRAALLRQRKAQVEAQKKKEAEQLERQRIAREQEELQKARTEAEEFRKEMEKQHNRLKLQHEMDKLVEWFATQQMTDWEQAHINAERIVSLSNENLEHPPLSLYEVYLQDQPVETVITGSGTKLIGHVKNDDEQIAVNIIYWGRVTGKRDIPNDKITDRYLTTPAEWKEVSEEPSDTDFDYNAWLEQQEEKREEAERRARIRRRQFERRAAEREAKREANNRRRSYTGSRGSVSLGVSKRVN